MENYTNKTLERTGYRPYPPTEKELDSFDKVAASLLCYVNFKDALYLIAVYCIFRPQFLHINL